MKIVFTILKCWIVSSDHGIECLGERTNAKDNRDSARGKCVVITISRFGDSEQCVMVALAHE